MSQTRIRVMQLTGLEVSSEMLANDIAYNVIFDLIQAIKKDATNGPNASAIQVGAATLLSSLHGDLSKAFNSVERRFAEDGEG